MSPPHIRRATLADLEPVAALFDLYRQFYDQSADREAARRFIRDRLACADAVIFVAELDGVAVGFTQLYPLFSSIAVGREWLLNDLYVAPVARRLGVGRALLEAARQHAIETGALRLELATAVTNIEAQRLYESLGYEREEGFVRYSLRIHGDVGDKS
jgi:ribosomal protein S18 acetylase RimI-like enzyme